MTAQPICIIKFKWDSDLYLSSEKIAKMREYMRNSPIAKTYHVLILPSIEITDMFDVQIVHPTDQFSDDTINQLRQHIDEQFKLIQDEQKPDQG